MDTIEMTTRVRSGSALPCAPVTVVPHAVAHAAGASVPGARPAMRRRRPDVYLIPANPLRTWGDVSPEGGVETAFHKSTSAFVPERRGGT